MSGLHFSITQGSGRKSQDIAEGPVMTVGRRPEALDQTSDLLQ